MPFKDFEGVGYGYRRYDGDSGTRYLKVGWEGKYLEEPSKWPAVNPIAVGSASYQIYGNEYAVMKWMEYRAQQEVKVEDALLAQGRTISVLKAKPEKSLITVARELMLGAGRSLAGDISGSAVLSHTLTVASNFDKLSMLGNKVQWARAKKTHTPKRAFRFTQEDVVIEISVGQALMPGDNDSQLWDCGDNYMKFGDIILWAWGSSTHYKAGSGLGLGLTF